MAKRHAHRPGEWESVAVRLDEIISAHSGEDPFDEALTLLVARLAHEVTAPRRRFAASAAEVDALVEAARARWPGIVEPGVRTRLSDGELARCAAVLEGARLVDDALVGLDAIFEHIVTRVAKGTKGQFFTPRHVIREVVAMMQPAAGENVVDPACGSGGFLCHALRAAPRCTAWGFDQDPRAVRVARVMLAASGAAAAQATRADSLRRGELEARVRRDLPRWGGFDLVLTNPPFAGDVGGAFGDYELARGRRVERDVLFVERVVELLRPGGRYAIVLPHNKVGGGAWAFVRRWLVERTEVCAVLALGRNTFQPHTGQKACVVIGKKRAAGPVDVARARAEPVTFFLGERDGKDHRGRLVRDAAGNVDCDLGDATASVRAALAGKPREGARTFIRTVGELGEALVLAPERFDPRRTVAASIVAGRRLGDLVEIAGENVHAAAFGAGARVLVLDTTHAWDGFVLARHAPVAPTQLGSAKRALAPGDVIVSRLRPYLRQVAFVDDALFARAPGGNAVVASTEFYVLRGRGGFDAAALVPYLLGDTVQAALAAGQEGGHHPRFDRALLADLPVPKSLAARAAAIAAEVRAQAAALRATLDAGRSLSAAVEARLRRAR